MSIHDHRSGDRYIATLPIPGSFSATSVSILNLADQGARIEHAQPLRLAARGRVVFRAGAVSVSATAIVVWSHLSKTPNEKGKYLYHSGLRIEGDIDEFTTALRQLVDLHVVRRDLNSLERKQRQLEEREAREKNKPVIKVLHEDEIPSDQALLIQHARERLKMNPDEARKWYQRARFAGAEEISTDSISYKEDVLAVWEYLERSVPLSHIVRVFERKG